jgi:hypothetical protein
MFPSRLIAIALSIVLLSVAGPAHSDEGAAPPEDGLLGWSITPGIGVRVVSLDVKRHSDGYTGTLTNDGSFSDPIYLSLDIESPSWMLSPKVGLSVRSHSQSFKLSRQQVPSSTSTNGQDYADLGTSVQGFYSYLGPTLFYRMVDPTGDSRLGIGYGYWKAWFEGDIILAENGAATPGTPSTSIDGSIDGTTGPMLFWQIRGKQLLFEIAVSNVTFSHPNYRFTLSELIMSVGYQFRF